LRGGARRRPEPADELPPEPLAQREDDTVPPAPRIRPRLGQARDGQEEFTRPIRIRPGV